MYKKKSITVAKKIQIYILIKARLRFLSLDIPKIQKNSAKASDKIQANATPIDFVPRNRYAQNMRSMYIEVTRIQIITEATKHNFPRTCFFGLPSPTLISESTSFTGLAF